MREVYPEDDYLPAVASTAHNTNLAEQMDEPDLLRIASDLLMALDDDIESRRPWTDRFRRGFEMMGLTADEIDDGPFPGSSTAVMPVISEAVVQFWARSLAEQVPSQGPVKGTVLGKVHEAQLQRAKRVADYMNHDLMVLDRSWYADHSRMLFALPYTGSCFKKSYRDEAQGRNCSVYVQAEDFICNYAFTDLDTAPRYAHRIWRTHNQIKKAQYAGMYRDVELQEAQIEDLPEESQIKIDAQDFEQTDGGGRSGDKRHELFEVYCELDLRGFEHIDQQGQPTGIALPYIVTLDKHSEKILSVYRGWKEQDPLMRRRVTWSKYDYLPGTGFYGFGLFHLIGGLQQAATGALRAIIDGAATASLQGGFISKDASMKDQNLTIEPGIWKQVDATAEDLGKAFFTPPFKEPSPVLFQIMGFLVQRAEKFAATTEMQTGSENAKNMPVGSTLAMLEAGGKVFSTIHRGLHKSLAEELRQRYELIQEFMPVEGYPYDVEGAHEGILAQDFAPGVSIMPVSDPNIFSQVQRVAMYQATYDLAKQNPNEIRLKPVLRRFLEGMGVPDIDEILVEDQPPPAPMDPVSEMQALLRGEPVQAYPDQMHQAYLQHYWAFMNNPQFGGSPQIQQQIGPAAVALLGQRLAYAWAEHARAQGVPAPMLPPPMGDPNAPPGQGPGQPPGQLGLPPPGPGPDPGLMPGQPGSPPGLPNEMGPQGPGLPPGQPMPPQQPPDSAQLAQMAAQIAPQMVKVPGLPAPPSPGDAGKEADNQIKQAELQLKQTELQMKQQGISLSWLELQSKAEAQQVDTYNKDQMGKIKAAIEMETLKQKQVETQAKAEREARLARQDEAEQYAREQKIAQQNEQIRQAEEKHAMDAAQMIADQQMAEQQAMIDAATQAAQAENVSRETAATIKLTEAKAKQAAKPKPAAKPGRK